MAKGSQYKHNKPVTYQGYEIRPVGPSKYQVSIKGRKVTGSLSKCKSAINDN